MSVSILYALIATSGTWFITALGAATVLFFKRAKQNILNIMLGFSAGVMIAASFWSMLLPAAEIIENRGGAPYLTVTGGFISGALFILFCDKAVKKAFSRAQKANDECDALIRTLLLVFSITLHNIPEGLAVGVAFGALHSDNTPQNLAGAISVAVGIGLQNFPEGAAVSLPLKREGYSRLKSFAVGQASGIVEPVAGVIGAAAVTLINRLLPFALSFAAGTMIFVSFHELIPECKKTERKGSYTSTLGIIAGFTLMTLFDVMLG